MSSDVAAIHAEGLSKLYQLGPGLHYKTLRDTLAGRTRSLFRRQPQAAAREAGSQAIWALRDVSFEVPRGDVVGVIGRNGAGKSTLLKLLSRITEPTEGWAEIHGRVGSLLEVGTGFHPELSGRDNVFLNGSIIGMTRAEIRQRFDAIVAFAEIERFLDTPVKHYSSGMYMRLAFAVAAHLDTEILIVDEVLAVGDAAFQRRCLGKMGDVARQGRTVLFVSHNMDAVRRLCRRTLWLQDGRLARDGDTVTVVSEYLLRDVAAGSHVTFDPPLPFANDIPLRLRGVALSDPQGRVAPRFSRTDPIEVRVEWQSLAPLYKPRIGFVLLTSTGTEVLTTLDASAWASETLPPGHWASSCVLPGGLLNEGGYILDVVADSPKGPAGRVYHFERTRPAPVLRFEVEDDRTVRGRYYGEEGFRDARWPGVVLLDLDWKLVSAEAPGVQQVP